MTPTQRDGARVLEHAIDLCAMPCNGKLTFGEAVQRAKGELGIALDQETEAVVLACLVRVIMNRKFPGAADA